MKVSPAAPVSPTTPVSGNGGQSGLSSNTATSANREPEPRPYRIKEHQPTISVDEVVASQRHLAARLETLLDKLGLVVNSAGGPSAALGSPIEPEPERRTEFDKAVEREVELGKLERTKLPNGHVHYRLPLNSMRNLGYELVGKRDAFVDRGEHLELAGSGSNHLRAATLHAARKWGNAPVVIYAEGKHLDAVIEHAVRAGLNIANEHPTIVAKVAAERERQANPLGIVRATTSARAIRERDVAPIIARVRSV